MMKSRWSQPAIALAASVMLCVACQSGAADQPAAGTPAAAASDAPASQGAPAQATPGAPAPATPSDPAASAGTGSPPPAQPPGNRGSAHLVVGDQEWTFDNYLCAFGLANTQSDIFPFSSASRMTSDSATIYLNADVEDDSGQGLMTGSDVLYEITIDDLGDLDIGSDQDLSMAFDGDNVTAQGTFYDSTADVHLPGTFEGVCGPQSIR